MKEFLLVDAHPTLPRRGIVAASLQTGIWTRTSPGGQRRSKVATACEIVHEPTGVMARTEMHRPTTAEWRCGDAGSTGPVVRTSVHHERYRPSALWEKRRQGRMLPVNPKHYEYPALLAEALDVIVARRWDVAGTAGVLGISMSQLARLLRHDKAAFDLVNEGRQSMGLPRLR